MANKIPVKYEGKVVGYYDPETEVTAINKEHIDEIMSLFGSHHIGISSRSFAKSMEDKPTIKSFDIFNFKSK